MKRISMDDDDEDVQDDEPEIAVEGEALVDGVGAAAEEYWKACRGKKGKGKAKADGKVWESFCAWLEEMEDQVEDENLTVFLTTNLTAALSLAPPSPFLSLLHLRHLLRTTAPHSDILALAKQATAQFGRAPTPDPTREQLWAARAEAAVALSASADEAQPVLDEAVKAIPFSGRVWDVYAEWAERSEEDVGGWYERAVRRVLLADARHPVGFESALAGERAQPREALPRRYLAFLVATAPATYPAKAVSLLNGAPALSLDFLRHALELAAPATLAGVGEREVGALRRELLARITGHDEAGPAEWCAAAEELLRRGEVVESGEVVKRAKRALQGGRGWPVFETMWARVLDA